MKYLLLALLVFVSTEFSAQNTEGQITYLATLDYDSFKEKLEKAANDQPEHGYKLNAMMRAARDLDYSLSFNKNESYFNENEGLESDGNNQYTVNTVRLLAGIGDVYSNQTSKEILSTNPSFEGWLIKDNVLQWELVNESKVINGHTCYKAIAYEEVNKEEGEQIKFLIEAWYNPDIPLPYGPSIYCGLPGLILELTHERGLIFKAKKIKFKKRKSPIQRPEGEVISNDVFQSKIKELRKKYRS
jgi:GLPGLI family protein